MEKSNYGEEKLWNSGIKENRNLEKMELRKRGIV